MAESPSSAFANEAASQSPINVASASAAAGMHRALLIGEENYAPTKLSGAANSVNNMAKALVTQESFAYDSENVHVLHDASKAQVLTQIQALAAQAAPEDTTLFYFVGYGVRSSSAEINGSLRFMDESGAHDPQNYLTPAELADALEQIPGTVAVILDSSYAGAFLDYASERMSVLVACSYDQQIGASYDWYENNTRCFYTFFTRALLEGMGFNVLTQSFGVGIPADENGDQQLSVSELHAYASSHLPLNGAEYMTPQVGSQSATQIVVSRQSTRIIEHCDVAFPAASLVFNGQPQTLDPDVTFSDSEGTITLTPGVDYMVTYENNVNAGEATAVITGMGNWLGTKRAIFTVQPKPIRELTISAPESATYDGLPHMPSIVVADGAAVLECGVDYTVTYSNNVEPGTANAQITMVNPNYTGSLKKAFYIFQKSVTTLSVTLQTSSFVYSGEAFEPEVVVRDAQTVFLRGVDYEVNYADNVEVGQGWVTVTMLNSHYRATPIYRSFAITPKPFDRLSFSQPGDVVYNGSAHKPTVTVHDGERQLAENKDYYVEYGENTNAGDASITVASMGLPYEGSTTIWFSIAPKPIEQLVVSQPEDCVFAGAAACPWISVKDSDGWLQFVSDYEVSYENNDAPGTALAVVTMVSPNYTGTMTREFQILSSAPVPEQGEGTEAPDDSADPTDSINPPDPTDPTDPIDLPGPENPSDNADPAEPIDPVDPSDPADPSDSATSNDPVPQTPKSLDELEVVWPQAQTYSGESLTPEVVVKDAETVLVQGVHYTVTYADNVNPGFATMHLVMKEEAGYSGGAYGHFQVSKRSIERLTITAPADQTYTGSAIEPAMEVFDGNRMLIEGEDYSVFYDENINAGQAHATVRMTGPCYTGEVMLDFVINPLPASQLIISQPSDVVYASHAAEPEVTVRHDAKTLRKGSDYQLTYENNNGPGQGSVTVWMTNPNYVGSVTRHFAIFESSGTSIDDLIIEWPGARTYTGEEITPSPAVFEFSTLLQRGMHYDVSYRNNLHAGLATVEVCMVEGSGYTGTASHQFLIRPKQADSLTVSNIARQVYTGKPVCPKVTVRDGEKVLSEGADYRLDYANNVNEGTASVIVTMLNTDYEGALLRTFSIKKPVGFTDPGNSGDNASSDDQGATEMQPGSEGVDSRGDGAQDPGNTGGSSDSGDSANTETPGDGGASSDSSGDPGSFSAGDEAGNSSDSNASSGSGGLDDAGSTGGAGGPVGAGDSGSVGGFGDSSYSDESDDPDHLGAVGNAGGVEDQDDAGGSSDSSQPSDSSDAEDFGASLGSGGSGSAAGAGSSTSSGQTSEQTDSSAQLAPQKPAPVILPAKTTENGPKAIALRGASIKSLKKGTRQFRVIWKRSAKNNASGYQIRYSLKSSMKGAKTKSVKGWKATTLTVKKLKAKKKYYVQIRVYKTINGKKHYSSWSKTKVVKTK